MNLLQRIKLMFDQLINVSSDDPDDARRRKLLNIILVGMTVVAISILIATLILSLASALKVQDVYFLLIASVATIIGVVVFYLINRLWSGKLASVLFLIFLMVVITMADEPVQLANGRSVFLFSIPIIVASVLVGPTSTFLFYVFCSIEIAVLAQVAGIPVTSAVFPATTFFLLALVAWLSARNLEQALNDLRKINANLDSLVVQKTQELASALSRELVLAGRNQAILDSIADGVIVFDSRNIAILANPALSQLSETPLPNLMGIEFSKLIENAQLSAAHRGKLMALIENPQDTLPGFRVEWGKRTLSTSIARVHDTAGENIGTVAVFRDVSREAELEKMKDTFVAIVSHELRTPLSAILGFAEMLKESVYGPLNERQLSITERVLANAQRLLSMVGDLLDEAQIRAGKLSIKLQVFKTASLLESLHHTMDKIANDKGLSLTDTLDPAMPNEIKGDPQRLQQVLVNLVNNSIKFTEKGGVHIHIFRSEPDCWSMQVTDTGVGIPETEIPYIFDTFRQVDSVTTRKQGGFGLGLSIVKQLVELMGGEISVKSEEGNGSVFTATLPLEAGW